MTFVNEEELKSKNKLIEKYLNNRRILKKSLRNEIQSKQQLQESASEILRPITEKLEETQKKTDERQDKLIQDLQLHIGETPKRSVYAVDFEIDFSDEEKQLLEQHNLKTDVVELVQHGPDYITDLKNKTILINQRLGGQRKKRNVDTAMIDRQISVFRKYREKLNSLLKGMELTVGRGFNNHNKLCERLNLLVAAKQAGNNNTRLNEEIRNILKKLKTSKCISPCDYKKLCDVILK